MRKAWQVVASVILAVSLLVSGCGDSDPPGVPPPAAILGQGAAAPAAVMPAPHPTTEGALIEALAEAIRARDLKAVQALAEAELVANLQIWHDSNPGLFWRRGQRWVVNVESGFTIPHRDQSADKRWRANLEFANGGSENVVFTRIDGKLLFETL